VVIHDPRAGRIAGHQQFKQFVKTSAAWLTERQARAEPVATTAVSGRIVVELLAHLVQDGRRIDWPFAVVAEPSGDGQAIQFRSYYSQWPLTGRHHQRDPILPAGAEHPGDVVADYQAALAAGDAEAIVAAFEPDGYFREPSGPLYSVRGREALREFFTGFFSAGAASTFHPRPALPSMNVDRPGGWRPPASTTTSRHPSKRSERARPDGPCAGRHPGAWQRGRCIRGRASPIAATGAVTIRLEPRSSSPAVPCPCHSEHDASGSPRSATDTPDRLTSAPSTTGARQHEW
jgi:SnoaL-like protein